MGVSLHTVPSLKRRNFAGVRVRGFPPPAHTDVINISTDLSVRQHKEKKSLSGQYLRFIEKSEH